VMRPRHPTAFEGGERLIGSFLLILLATFALSLGNPAFAATTTTTHTRPRVTTTATVTETTTAPADTPGARAFVVLVVLLAVAASLAIVAGYWWGRKRARKDLLRVS